MTPGVALVAASAAPAARCDVHPRSTALLVCVGLALFIVASRLEAAGGALAASASRVGALQIAAAVLVGLWAARVARAPSRRLLRAGAAAACALAALWLASRTAAVAGRAPVGVLDALTAADELLLAGFALAAADPGRVRREGWSALGGVAISLSFVVLAMGCEPSPAPASEAGAPIPLICHLY